MADFHAGTGAGLREFLERAGARGDLNTSTATALRAAVAAVLELEDDPEVVDVRHIDVDEILGRFEKKSGNRYTPKSLRTYKSRFRNAVEMYRLWLEDDAGWKRVVRSRPTSASQRSGRATAEGPRSTEDQSGGVVDARPPERGPRPQMLTYDLPLRPDLLVKISLPVDLTRRDAERVAVFVRSLAFEADPNSLGAVPGEAVASEGRDQ